MKNKCCKKHKKSCGEAGMYASIWDSYCCKKCPELLAYNEARRHNNEVLEKKYKGKVFCTICLVRKGEGLFDSSEELAEHEKKEHGL